MISLDPHRPGKHRPTSEVPSIAVYGYHGHDNSYGGWCWSIRHSLSNPRVRQKHWGGAGRLDVRWGKPWGWRLSSRIRIARERRKKGS